MWKFIACVLRQMLLQYWNRGRI